MAFKKELYDENWRDTVRPAVLQRAGYKCQDCGAKQRAAYVTENKVRTFLEDALMLAWAQKRGLKIKRIFLSVSHENHITRDDRPENLKARCQFCHLKHDREYHKLSRIGKRGTLPRAQ